MLLCGNRREQKFLAVRRHVPVEAVRTALPVAALF